MTNNTEIINFKIDTYHALSENIISPDDWKSWLKNSDFKSEQKVPTNYIPPMIRRRMSPLSKIAVQTALELIENNPHIEFIVFSSRHGELPRTVELIQSILHGEDASPMAFSQSVHNTAAGLTTITAKKTIPVTSLSAGEDTFHQALIESYIYLSEHPDKKVLLVDFDSPLPKEYQDFQCETFATYAIGFVLSSNQNYRVSWQRHLKNSTEERSAIEFLPQSIQCLSHLIADDTKWESHSNRSVWNWEKLWGKEGNE